MVGEIASKQNDDSSALIIIIILSFDIVPFPYKHDQRRITFDCQRIDVD